MIQIIHGLWLIQTKVMIWRFERCFATCKQKINARVLWCRVKHYSISGQYFRSSRPEMFLKKGVLKICSKFTGEHPCRGAISAKLFCNFIEIALQHGCSPVNLLHVFRTPFLKNTSGRLLLIIPFHFLQGTSVKLCFLFLEW